LTFRDRASFLFGLLPMPGNPARYQKKLDRAARRAEKGQVRRALHEYDTVVRILSSVDELSSKHRTCLGRAHLQRGQLLQAEGDVAEAAHAYMAARAYTALSAEISLFLVRWFVEQDPQSDMGFRVAVDYLAQVRQGQAEADPTVASFVEAQCRVEEGADRDAFKANLQRCRLVLSEDPQVEWAHFYMGLALAAGGQYVQAIKAFNTATRLDPSRPETAYHIALCSGKLRVSERSFDAALDAFEQAVTLRPDAPEPVYLAGWTCVVVCDELELTDPPNSATLIATRAQEAIERLQTVVSRDPTNAQYSFMLGRAQAHRGQFEAAQTSLAKAVALDSTRKEFYTYLAAVLEVLGQSADANEALKTAYSLDKKNPEIFRVTADICMIRGVPEQAVKNYNQALLLDKSCVRAMLGLGQALFLLGDYQKAKRNLAALPSRPRKATLCLARSYLRTGDTAQALELLTKAASRPDAGWDELYYLGCARAHAGEFPEAVEWLSLAIGADTSRWQAYLQRGHAFFASGDYEAARDDYQTACAESNAHPEVALALGVSHGACGDAQKAGELAQTVVNQAPDVSDTSPELYLQALQLMGWAAEAGDSADEANAAYEKVAEAFPEAAYAFHRLGLLSCAAEQWDQALAHLRRAVQLGDDGDAVLFHLGFAAASVEEYEEAIEAFSKLSERCPDDERVALNRRRSGYLAGCQCAQGGEWTRAAEYWEASLKSRPEDEKLKRDVADAYFRAAEAYLSDATKCSDAQMLLELGLLSCPEHWSCRYFDALLNADLGEYGAASEALAELAAEAPTPLHATRALYHLALTQTAAGRGQHARQTFESALQKGPWTDLDLPLDFVYATVCAVAGDCSAALQAIQPRPVGGAATSQALSITNPQQGAVHSNDRLYEILQDAAQVPLPQTAAAAPALLQSYCLLRLGEMEGAEALLSAAASQNSHPMAHYYLGLVQFSCGRLSQAAGCLERAVGDVEASGQALAVVCKFWAQTRAAEGNWEEAVDALQRALAVGSEDPELQEMLRSLGGYAAYIVVGAGRHEEAAQLWEEAQQRDPHDLRATHSLALLYYWKARSLEDAGHGAEAAKAWQGAIRNWVALCSSDEFWSRWTREREQYCGSVPANAVATLQTKLLEHLERTLTEYADAARDDHRASDLERLTLLSAKLSAERRAVEALAAAAAQLQDEGRSVDTLIICGAMMLEHLDRLPTANRLFAVLESAHPTDETTDDLHWALSPWVLAWSMVKEGSYARALDILMPALEQQASSKDGHDLAAMAHLEQGKAMAASGDILQALDTWYDGLSHVRDRRSLRDQIEGQVEETAVRESTRWKRSGPRSNLLARPIETLRLSASVCECLKKAGIVNLGQLVDRTMTDLRNVRKLPKNAQAKIARELKKINLSFKPSGDDDRDLHAAISILEAALRSVNTERLRINLSEHYTSLGIIAGNEKRRDECQQHL